MGSPLLHALSQRPGRCSSPGSWQRGLLVSSRRLVSPPCSSTRGRPRASIDSARIVTIAFTRSVPPTIVNCELTHLKREPIDFARAVEQHGLYERELVAAGCGIRRLPDLSELPDSVFVEDTAVVLPEIAIIARPGAASRRPEVPSVADALRPHRPLKFIESPGTLDGGDVLVIGSTIYVGESARTNSQGIRQLADFTSVYGYAVRPVKVSQCLHLKSAVTRVAEELILVNSAWVD